jgi:hypothetical protein
MARLPNKHYVRHTRVSDASSTVKLEQIHTNWPHGTVLRAGHLRRVGCRIHPCKQQPFSSALTQYPKVMILQEIAIWIQSEEIYCFD